MTKTFLYQIDFRTTVFGLPASHICFCQYIHGYRPFVFIQFRLVLESICIWNIFFAKSLFQVFICLLSNTAVMQCTSGVCMVLLKMCTSHFLFLTR